MNTRQDTKEEKKRSETKWKRRIKTFRYLERIGLLARQGEDGKREKREKEDE
jgi:hypothetical protein